jgi:glycerophosphoryl diester phosphodiesterase
MTWQHPPWNRRSGWPPWIVAHRGYHKNYPENTLSAFEQAYAVGAHGIELDVFLSADHRLVVTHDLTLTRATNQRDNRAIDTLHSEEIQKVTLDRGENIPLLSNVLSWAQDKALLINIEMKRDTKLRWELVKKLAFHLETYPASIRERYLVSSFDPYMLELFRRLLPSVATGALFHQGQQRYLPFRLVRLLQHTAAHPEHVMLNAARVGYLRSRKIGTNTWTVNDPQRAARLAAEGVDSLITDETEKLLHSLY